MAPIARFASKNNAAAPARPGLRRLATIASLLAIVVTAIALALPTPALALQTMKCTARPNADSGNAVLGGTETRVTWEAQAGADESIKEIAIVFPSGSSFSADDARVTMLSGSDLMTREFLEITTTVAGDALEIVLDEPAPAGAYLRIEIYGVVFPASGGATQLSGTYTLADDVTLPIDYIPSIDVTGITAATQLANWLEGQGWVQSWNQNKFLRLFLNPPILVKSFPIVVKGFFMAVAIVLVAFPLAIPFGLVLALMRISRFRLLRTVSSLYVNVIRGTPVFLQIYIAFFGLPLAGIQIPSFLLGVIVLAMNSCAYQCEIFRAGIQSIHKGQFEASRSLGMNGAQTMLHVIIPQTIRRIIPTMTSEFILLYKDTSLLAAVGVMEIVMYAKTIVASTGSITPYIVAACFYLVITMPLARLVGWLERKLASDGAGRPDADAKKGRRPAAALAEQPVTHVGLVDRLAEEATVLDDETQDGAITPEQMSSL